MNRRVLAIALVFGIPISTAAKVSTEQRRARLLQLRTEGSHVTNKSLLDQAYLDAVQLLEQSGQCAAFFGGRDAVKALDSLVVQIHEERMNDSYIGISMNGPFMLAVGTNLTYRVFDHAALNINGPFKKAKVFADEPFVPGVGSFRPNTREARVLILMHELGHLIERDHRWLLPDDGTSPAQSRQNTKIVEKNCGAQIRAL
jgi:hypothetical protein